jgi:flagellar hook-associated protein FlgK
MVLTSTQIAGLNGLMRALEGMNASARAIATSTSHATDSVDPSVRSVSPSAAQSQAGSVETALVDLRTYLRQGQASARVIEAADETLGTLIDELA